MLLTIRCWIKKIKKISLKGVINVEKNMVYNDEVFIEKGTNFAFYAERVA